MAPNQPERPDRATARKPAGGFQFIPAAALIAAWRAYDRGVIQLQDLRSWFGIHESLAARTTARRAAGGRSHEDVTVPSGGAGVRALRKAGLLLAGLKGVRPPLGIHEVPSDLLPPELLDLVTNHHRQVPVPRRMLRYLSHCSRPAVIAAAVAHLLRGMYYRGGACVVGGTCKASWISEVFRIDLRTAKEARREWVKLGWLTLIPTNQIRLNRWGQSFAINLEWTPPRPDVPPPPSTPNQAESPPPRTNGQLSQGRSEYQKRIHWGPNVTKPTWRHVTELDLGDARRLASLYRQARLAGMFRDSAAQRLAFFAAARHALHKAARTATGLFVTIVRSGLWHHASDRAEDEARSMLRTLATVGADVHTQSRAAAAPASRPSPHPTHDLRSAGEILLGINLRHASRAVPEYNTRRLDAELLAKLGRR